MIHSRHRCQMQFHLKSLHLIIQAIGAGPFVADGWRRWLRPAELSTLLSRQFYQLTQTSSQLL